MKMFLETVSLRDIDVAASPKVRATIHEEAVEDYSHLYKDKKPMPKAVLCKVAIGHYLVADGMHRVAAMISAGIPERAFDVFQGTYEDCLLYAAGCNQTHGVRRTGADKRAAIKSVLAIFPKKKDVEIASIVGVTDKTVAAVRHPERKKKKPVGISDQTTEVPSNNGDAEAQAVRPVTDDMGLPVPTPALAVWRRRQEAQDLLSTISHIKTTLAKALREHDPLYAEVTNTIISDIERVYGSLSVAKPYTICPRCQGNLPDNCTTCSRRGVISKFYWDVKIDAETKKLRSNLAAKK
jgi:hypothetical protein